MAGAMNTSRKRRHEHDYSLSTETTPHTKSTTSWSTSFSPRTISPAPLANSRYQLSGGLDTPIAVQQTVYDKYAGSLNTFDLDFRRGRPYADIHPPDLHEAEQLPAPLARESNGRPRAQKNAITSDSGWSKAVFSTLTGAAGKVLDFCRVGTSFRGFFAGGGQGYNMQTPYKQRQENKFAAENAWEDEDASPQTPMPGQYPQIQYVEDYMDAPEVYSARASKKSKTSYGDSGNMSNSWVMVNESPSRRKVPASTASPASIRRPVARLTTRRSTAIPAPLSASRPASAAGLRSPIAARAQNHSRTTSRDAITSPRSARPSLQPQPDSPIARETAKHIEQMRRREKKEDREMMQFNKRLQDMIREGKEALGSRVEIEMEGSDDEMW